MSESYKCYLCGEIMIDRPKDYQSSPEKYSNLAIKHKEHIIQNSLYGRLTDENILCEKCGSKLSNIDSDFCEIFNGITEPIKFLLASKDHGNSKKKSLSGYIFTNANQSIEVTIIDGKAAPKKPFYELIDNTVNIFATEKVAKGYRKKVENELESKNIEVGNLQFNVVDDITNMGILGINFSEGIDSFNSKFKLGLNKIATGFAIAKGVDREDLPCVLDTKNQAIIFNKNTPNVVAFYPNSAIDRLIEPFRIVLEYGYPTHTLILFTDNFLNTRKLICYVDLFSSFQFYVILNHDYHGEEVNKSYYQTIIKQEKPIINVRNTRYKYLGLLANDLGVPTENLKDKTIDEIYDYLERVYIHNDLYKLDLDEYVKNISGRVILNVMARKQITKMSHLGVLEKEILDTISDFDINDLLLIQAEQQHGISYRQKHFEIHKNQPVLFSTFYESIKLSKQNQDVIKEYTYFKFYQLSNFIYEKIKNFKTESE